MLNRFLALLLTFILISCGGGGSSSSSKPASPPPNNPPIATNDNFEVGMNISTVLNVLANDKDTDKFTITQTSAPTNGSVIQNDSGLVYTPSQTFVGQDSFSYTITDSIGQSATATVSLTISNLPPVVQQDFAQTQQNLAVSLNPLSNDNSPAGHEITLVSLSLPNNGSVKQDGEEVTYTPNTGYAGEDSFVYIVKDSYGDQSTGTVNISVNNVLPVLEDDEATTLQNQKVTVNVLANDHDVLGDELTLSSVAENAKGLVEIIDNQIVYTPLNGFAGEDVIQYSVIDNYQGEQQANLTITVTNQVPTANNDVTYIKPDAATNIDVLVNDNDVMGDSLTLTSVTSPQHGSAEITNGIIKYQPNSGFTGDDSFSYTITDSHNALSTATVTLRVANTITFQGKIVGYEKPNTVVRIKNGDMETTSTTNEQGEFTFEFEQTDKVVVVYADDITENYHLRAYLSAPAIVQQSIQLTDFSTAEYQLINKLLNGEEAATQAELEKNQYLADSYHQLIMAASARLINDDNGIDLPLGFPTVNSFLDDINLVTLHMADWRDDNNELFRAAFSSFIDNTELASYPTRLTDGELLVTESSGFYGNANAADYPLSFTLEGNSASIDGHLAGASKTTQNTLLLDFSNDNINDWSYFTYCKKEDQGHYGYAQLIDIESLEFSKIYSTSRYDLYLTKIKASPSRTMQCEDSKIETLYNTYRHYRPTTFTVAPGEYAIEKRVISSEWPEVEISLLTLHDDNTFIDNEEADNILYGSWSNYDNTLVLNYDDGRMFTYVKIGSQFGTPELIGKLHQDQKLQSTFSTHLMEIKPFNWPHKLGKLSSIIYSEAQSISELNYSDIDEPKWTQQGNKYTFSSYRNFNYFVDYCDINQPDCYISSSREYEFIGESNGVYMIKYYFFLFEKDGSIKRQSESLYFIHFIPE